MKCATIKLNLIFFFILRFYATGLGQGIPEGIDIPTFIIPSNQTWSFIKYGGYPGEIYTGTVGTTIPIFEYKDDDFTIPINLNYTSNGYMPNRAPGITGLGWYLNIGGTITREIHGFPDDRNIRFTCEDDGDLSYLGYFCRLMSEFNNPGLNLGFQWLMPSNQIVTFTSCNEVEHDPDIFHFSFMEHSGSFVGYGENTVCYNTSEPANEYKIVTFTNLNSNKDWWDNVPFGTPNNIPGDKLYEQDKLKTIYIITGDGLRYQFKALEVSEHSMFNHYDIPLKLTWYLTKICAPNGREVIFDYQAGSFVRNIYPLANNMNFSETAPSATTKGGKTSSTSYYPYYLRSIKIKDNPDYSDTDSRNRTLVTLSYVEKEMINVVRSIKIDKDGNGVDKTYSFGYNVYGQVNNQIPFLATLNTPLGSYTFSYLDINNAVFHNPRKNLSACFSVDHWGFYNGKSNTNMDYIPNSTLDYRYDETITGTSRDADFSMAKRGMLETIYYPTKGKTVFEYEPHAYSKQVVRKSDNQKPFYPQLITVSGTSNLNYSQ